MSEQSFPISQVCVSHTDCVREIPARSQGWDVTLSANAMLRSKSRAHIGTLRRHIVFEQPETTSLNIDVICTSSFRVEWIQ